MYFAKQYKDEMWEIAVLFSDDKSLPFQFQLWKNNKLIFSFPFDKICSLIKGEHIFHHGGVIIRSIPYKDKIILAKAYTNIPVHIYEIKIPIEVWKWITSIVVMFNV